MPVARQPRSRRRLRGDRGEGVAVLVLATGVVLVLVVQILNVVVFSYGKGTVRTALDEAARAGATNNSVAVCEATADQVMDELLGGSLGAEVDITCSDTGIAIVASADVHFDAWLTSLADYDGTFSASAAKENR